MKISYPVIFTETENNILIEVPDLGILTQSNDEKGKKASSSEAICSARNAIGLYIAAEESLDKTIPSPSIINEIDINHSEFLGAGQSFVSLVDVDPIQYKNEFDNKMVRCNVTIKRWMKKAAEEKNLNISRILQDTLEKVLTNYQ